MWAGQSVAVLKANSQKGPLDLVFPSGRGNVERMSSILRLGWCPLQIKCGLTGETGSHRYGFPHAQACRRVAIHPLLRWTPKRLQAVMGHSSVSVTFDLYGHLFENLEADR